MKYISFLVLHFSLIFVLAGCAGGNFFTYNKPIAITYNSDPIGATVYIGGRSMGVTPVTKRFNVTLEQYGDGTADIKNVVVRWVSGAEASIPSLHVDFRNNPSQEFFFKRPNGYPDVAVDANYAMQILRVRMQQRQENIRVARCNQIAKTTFIQARLQPITAEGLISGSTQAVQALGAANQAKANCLAGLPYVPPVSPYQVQRSKKASYNCSSMAFGNMINTTCHEQ